MVTEQEGVSGKGGRLDNKERGQRVKRYCDCCGKIFEQGKSDRTLCRSCNGLVKYIATAFRKADFLPTGIQGGMFRHITTGKPLWFDLSTDTPEEFFYQVKTESIRFYKTLDNKNKHIDCYLPMKDLLRLKNFKREEMKFMKSNETLGFGVGESAQRFVIGVNIESEVTLGDIIV